MPGNPYSAVLHLRFLASFCGLIASCLPVGGTEARDDNAAPKLLSRTGGKGAWSSVAEVERAAIAGDARAQADFGDMLAAGMGVPADLPRAIVFLERAARQGQASAAFRLGKLHETGEGVRQDHSRAVAYYRAAAAGGIAEAFYNVGAAYASGRGVKRDFAEGLAWMILATRNGAPSEGEQAIREQLQRMRRPELIRRGEARAAELEREIQGSAVEAFLPQPGDRSNQLGAQSPAASPKSAGKFKPGDTLAPPTSGNPKGLALPTRPTGSNEAVDEGSPVKHSGINGQRLEWPSFAALERAAARREPDACFVLGQVFLDGDKLPHGFEPDVDKAVIYLERGAEAGSLDATFRLAELYLHGRKVPRDDQRAFRYMLAAARGGARTAVYNVGSLYINGRGTEKDLTTGLAWLLVAEKFGAGSSAVAKIRGYLERTSPEAIPVAERRAAELEREIEGARRGMADVGLASGT